MYRNALQLLQSVYIARNGQNGQAESIVEHNDEVKCER